MLILSQQSIEKVPDYTKRLQTLKTLTNYIDSPPSAHSLRNKINRQGSGDDALREIRQLQSSKEHTDLRKELLNGTKNKYVTPTLTPYILSYISYIR